MEVELIDRNITVLAELFNPSIFNEYWLRKNKIISDDVAITPASIFTQQFVNLQTNVFSASIMPNQLQFSYQSEDNINILIKLIDALPHIPYKAIGINFTYFLPITSDDGSNASRTRFTNDRTRLYSEFGDDNCRFGAYLSKDFSGSRLKLNILPVKAQKYTGVEVERLQYAFNFHSDLIKENSFEELKSKINSIQTFAQYAFKLVKDEV